MMRKTPCQPLLKDRLQYIDLHSPNCQGSENPESIKKQTAGEREGPLASEKNVVLWVDTEYERGLLDTMMASKLRLGFGNVWAFILNNEP